MSELPAVLIGPRGVTEELEAGLGGRGGELAEVRRLRPRGLREVEGLDRLTREAEELFVVARDGQREDPRLLGVDAEGVRDAARQPHDLALAGPGVGAVEVDREAALEHVEGLVLVGLDVQRGRHALRREVLEHRDRAAGALRADPDGDDLARDAIIRTCASGLPARELFAQVGERLRPLVPYASAGRLSTDPATMLYTDAVVENVEGSLH